MIRVLVADDHGLLCEGLRRSLESVSEEIVICAEAEDGEKAVRLAEQVKPDVILMDIQMPKMNGIEATRAIHQKNPDIPVVILTTYDDDDLVKQALQAGAKGYLLKAMSMQDLVGAIRRVNDGKEVMDPHVTSRMMQRIVSEKTEFSKPAISEPVSRVERPLLSPRELQILRMLVAGHGNKEIANQYSLSEGTVKTYVSRIYEKLKVSDRAQAAASAIRLGLVN